MYAHTYLPIIIDLPAKMQRALMAPSLWNMPKKTYARTKLGGSKDGYPVAALPPPSQLMLGRCGNQRCAHHQACPGRTTSMCRPGEGGQETANVRNRLAGDHHGQGNHGPAISLSVGEKCPKTDQDMGMVFRVYSATPQTSWDKKTSSLPSSEI